MDIERIGNIAACTLLGFATVMLVIWMVQAIRFALSH